MLRKTKYKKFIYFWFLPFSVGVYLSIGYLITHKVLFKSNTSANKADRYQDYAINNNSKPQNFSKSLKQESLIIKNIKEEKSFPKVNITINTESTLKELNDKPSSAIKLLKNTSDKNIESQEENQTENSTLLKKASSDKLEKIYKELFQTLPKP